MPLAVNSLCLGRRVHRHVCLIGRRVLEGQVAKVGNHLEAASARKGGRNGVGNDVVVETNSVYSPQFLRCSKCRRDQFSLLATILSPHVCVYVCEYLEV
jgi:hypothetical protein